jgi:hypothetical protein
MVHCNINRDSLVVTADGSWKLAGFAFAVGEGGGAGAGAAAAPAAAPAWRPGQRPRRGRRPLPRPGRGAAAGCCSVLTPGGRGPPQVSLDAGGNATEPVVFEYSSGQPFSWELLARPPLPYSAPEIVGSWGGPSMNSRVTAAADAFSLALVTWGPGQRPATCLPHPACLTLPASPASPAEACLGEQPPCLRRCCLRLCARGAVREREASAGCRPASLPAVPMARGGEGG